MKAVRKPGSRLAYVIMIIEGLGTLFPWNAIITAAGYYGARFCGTPVSNTFENYFSITYSLTQTLSFILSIFYEKKFTMHQKVVIPLCSFFLIFVVASALVFADISPMSLFWVTMISIVICGLNGAFLSTGLFGLAAMFPPAFTGALMNGQGFAGLIVSLCSILTILAGPASDNCNDDALSTSQSSDSCKFSVDYSGFAYFLITALVIGSCIVFFFFLLRMDFTKYYMTRQVRSVDMGDSKQSEIYVASLDLKAAVEETITSPLIGSSSNSSASGNGLTLSGRLAATEALLSDQDPDNLLGTENPDYLSTTSSQAEEEDLTRITWAKLSSVYKHIRIPSICVLTTFAVTLSLFPSLTVRIQSMNMCSSSDRFSNDLFIPFMFLMFNLFDLIGRITAGATTPLFTSDNVWIPTVARFIFFPLFLLCNVNQSQLPIVFKSDIFPILFMLFFSFTNGYVGSLCMIYGPVKVPVKEASLAGTIMVFSLTFGLMVGSALSFVVVYISQGSF